MAEHVFDASVYHHAWDRELEPALAVEPGDVVHFDLLMAGDRQVHEGATFEQCEFDFDTLYNLAGPDARRGRESRRHALGRDPLAGGGRLGLVRDPARVRPAARGVPRRLRAHVRPARRLDDDARARRRDPDRAVLRHHGELPRPRGDVHPVPAPRGRGQRRHAASHGGHDASTSRCSCPGAHFSIGDPHAAQGDGEVCVAAIECPMRASLRFDVLQRPSAGPWFTTPPGSLTPRADGAGHYGTMGIAEDLMEGARIAVRNMIALLAERHGLEPRDAYMLCSLAGDLKILEIVDAGVWNVGMLLPRSVFV